MRIAYLIAGAGGMYCGSCLRDSRLAATLIRKGRDVRIFPLYTPLRTEDSEDNPGPVHFGGINVFLQNRFALFRRLPRWMDALLNAPWLLRGAGRLAAKTRPEDLGSLTVSVLQGEQGPLGKELGKLIDALYEIQPSLIHLPTLMFSGIAPTLKRRFSAPVLCTLAGEDIFLDALPEPFRSQSGDLIEKLSSTIDAFVSPTRYYATHAAKHFKLPADSIEYVPMGIHLADVPVPRKKSTGPFTIGYFARICREKGLHVLAEAFIQLRAEGRDVRLRAAGYLSPVDRPYLREVENRLRQGHCLDRFECLGETNRAGKLEFLRSLDVFSVPTVYHEAKGLYVLEAMAAGVPVVQPNHGSFPELVGDTGGGLLFDASNSRALSGAIGRLMDDEELRNKLSASGREGVRNKHTEDIMADRTWQLYVYESFYR